jgi:hypothetical protein
VGLTKIRAGQILNLDYKQSVRALSDTNVTLSGGAPLVVDGVSLLDIDRVLVNGQTDKKQNGIYRVLIPGTGSNGTWVRSSDANEDGEIEAGMIVMVTEGTVYKDTQWKLVSNDPIILGVTELIFEQNSAYAFGNIYANGTAVLANTVGDTLSITASNNISITGNATTKTVDIAVVASGSNSQIQYNVNGNLAASSKLTYIDGTGVFVNPGNVTANFFFGDGSGLTNIAAAAGTRIEFGTSNVALAEADGVANITVGGVANIVVVNTTGLVTFGNVTANNYVGYDGTIRLYGQEVVIVDDGSANAPGNLVATNLFVNTIRSDDSTFVEINDGLSTDEIIVAGNVSADYFLGNGALLTGIDTTLISNGNSLVQVISNGGNIIANVAGTNVMTISPELVEIDGNITANFVLGNGRFLSGIDTTLIANGNSLVRIVNANGNIEANVNGNNIVTIDSVGLTANGNLTSEYILANGRFLTGLTITSAFNNIIPGAEIPGDVETANSVPANTTGDLNLVGGPGIDISSDPANLKVIISAEPSEVDYDLVTQAANVTGDLGTITVMAGESINYGPIATYGGLFVSRGGITAGANITANLHITASGNISGAYVLGNGAFLTGIQTTLSGNTGEIQFNSSGNLASSPNLTFDNNTLTVTGNIEVGLVGSDLLPAADITYDLGNTNLRWRDLYLSGNTIYLGDGAQISANSTSITFTGPEGAEFIVTGNSAGNTTGEFGAVSATGNITANYFLGNGSQLTGINVGNVYVQSEYPANAVIGDIWIDSDTAIQYLYFNDGVTSQWAEMEAFQAFSAGGGGESNYSNANVAAYLPTYTGNLNSLTGNITTTANVDASYFIGNGSQLTGIQFGANVTVSGTAPASPSQGDIWIDTATGVQFIYFSDGDSNQWAEMEAATSISVTETPNLANISGNVIPSSDITYDLGNATNRWRDLYLSNSTIFLGEANISASGGNLILPDVIQIGNTTLDASSGNLALPEVIEATTIDSNTVIAVNVNANLGNFTSVIGNVTSTNVAANLVEANTVTVGNISISSDSITSADGTITIDPAAAGSSGLVIVAGNLQVTGTTTTVDSVTVTINDKDFNLANNAANASQADGGGIKVGPVGSEYATWLFDNSSNSWITTLGIQATANISAGNVSTAGILTVTGNANIGNIGSGIGVFTGNIDAANFNTTGAIAATSNITAGNISASQVTGNTVSDSKGDLRTVPAATKNEDYTLTLNDAGLYINSNANITVPNGVFSAGQSVTIFNRSEGNILLISDAGVTMYQVGTTNSGNRTLAQNGLATVFCTDANTFVITGGGLS